MRVLVIGSGAREHALCVALSSDPAVEALACAPGNAGTRALAEPLPVSVGEQEAQRGAPGRFVDGPLRVVALGGGGRGDRPHQGRNDR